MSFIKESIVKCDYCSKDVLYSEAYPCTNPVDNSAHGEYHICDSCLEQQFCEDDYYEQEERHYF